MKNKLIGPDAHGIVDYTYTALQVLGPRLFNLKGPARPLCYGFAGSQLLLNILTDYRLGVKRLVPFRVHGDLESPVIPALLLLPWATGALEQRKARIFFFSLFGISLATYLLTDYKANEREK
ncbi:hypothetical protein CLV24_11519 [Pontibacter ummariensis]|uniref:Uncharacterized protein n=1 Tax=Pontibacter ummariensis TaxID=1610492 RepID=A0A239HXA0_9BACT|nr:hypothetical protein [Pontibacter ummariensis]PRY10102.1 hypothetical protein CLV24_11519 [Pontibacter ummariensis]SNS85871.1 hypothetical protein SAMN06296052_11519 [Pontibacter ummariensis]